MSNVQARLLIALHDIRIRARQQPAEHERGATAVEYGMLVALITAVIVGTVALIGPELNTAFLTVVNGI